MKETMKAVVVHAPMQFDVERVPAPTCPEGGLLLKVNACGLCGSDLRTLRSGHRRVTFPWIIGHEICGTLERVGAGKWPVSQVAEALAARDRAACGPVAPPDGLYLAEVTYV